MDENAIIKKLENAISTSKGDWGRNDHLIKRIANGDKITNSDKLYLKNFLDVDYLEIADERKMRPLPKKNPSVTLNPNLVNCHSNMFHLHRIYFESDTSIFPTLV